MIMKLICFLFIYLGFFSASIVTVVAINLALSSLGVSDVSLRVLVAGLVSLPILLTVDDKIKDLWKDWK